MSNVQPYRSAADKTMRLHAQTGVIENGLVFCLNRRIGLTSICRSSRPFRTPVLAIKSTPRHKRSTG